MTRKYPYILAAVPAGYLPLSYFALLCYVLVNLACGVYIELVKGSLMWWIAWLGIWGTFVQWPFYIVWAFSSRELTLRLRLAWVFALVILNMLAIPYFLYCKYRGKTKEGLIGGLRDGALRSYLEGSSNDWKKVARGMKARSSGIVAGLAILFFGLAATVIDVFREMFEDLEVKLTGMQDFFLKMNPIVYVVIGIVVAATTIIKDKWCSPKAAMILNGVIIFIVLLTGICIFLSLLMPKIEFRLAKG